jgi:hypothetical protein
MQKVITVTTKAYIDPKFKFIETEYPELNKALTDGYIISQVIPVIQNSGNGNYYDTIFVLVK